MYGGISTPAIGIAGRASISIPIRSGREGNGPGTPARHENGRDRLAGDPRVGPRRRRMDGEIVATIRHTLEWNMLIPHNTIGADVCDGRVILTGYVYAEHDRERAEMLLRGIPGIEEIDNRIEIMTEEAMADRLRSSILDLLTRHGERMREQIGVQMKSGRVVLTGTVGSVAEKRLVIDALRWNSHVRAIEDRLKVGP